MRKVFRNFYLFCLSILLLSLFTIKTYAETQDISDISGPILDFPQTDGTVYTMALSDDESILYIGGNFEEIGGIPRNGLAAIDTSTYAVTDWNPNPSGAVLTIEVYGDSIYVGGEFLYIDDVLTGEFAKIDLNGNLVEDCMPHIHNLTDMEYATTVYSIKVTESYIYVGGSFNRIGWDANVVTGLLRLENTNSCTWDEEWTPTIQGPYDSPTVYSIDIDGDDIYIGGAIASVNGTGTGEFAKIDQEGELDESCIPDIHTYQEISTVYSIKTDTNHIYIGGSFNRIGSDGEEETIQELIRLNKNDCSRDSSWSPIMTGDPPTIYTISIFNDSVFVGGSLDTIQNQITEFTRLSKTTALADPLWNPQITTYLDIQTVYSSLVTNDYIYVGGSFNLVGGDEVLGLTAFNLDSRGPTGNIAINFDKQYTDKVNTNLTLYATDTLSDVSEMNICNNPSFTGCSWELYSTSKSWILDSSLGVKTVYVKFKDAAGNISETYSDTIILRTQSVRITEIGQVTGLADKSPLTVYFTSQTPLIKGVTQSGNTVYFVYEGNTYSTVADSSGNFSITLNVSLGTNTIQYYSKDISDNQSVTKTLNLIVGTQYFPESLLISMGLMTPTEQEESVPEEEETPDISEEENEEPEEEETPESSIQTLQFTDKEGNPLVNAYIEIDGMEYYTDSAGEIQVVGLEEGKNYKVKIEIDGVKYTTEVLGASGVDGSVRVTITEDDISKDIDWKNILIYFGIGLVLIFFLILIFRKKDKNSNI